MKKRIGNKEIRAFLADKWGYVLNGRKKTYERKGNKIKVIVEISTGYNLEFEAEDDERFFQALEADFNYKIKGKSWID